jgi:hypothetical protein
MSKAADGSENAIYEVACSEGPGYILIAKAADRTLVDGYECFALKSGNEQQAAEGKAVANALSCRLPANADPLAGFRTLAQPLVPGCTIDQARYLGANPNTKQANYEIGCVDRPGVILRVAGAGTPAGTPAAPPIRCEQIGADAPIQCQYTSKTEILAPITTLVAASGRQCQVTDGRYIGAAAGKPEDYYEAKCADGSGFLIIANTPANTFNRAIDCARATGAVSCSLTDAVAAQNQEASVYKALAVKGGFNCDVSQYRLLGAEQGGAKREVVELACKNQPEGVIAFFPAGRDGQDRFLRLQQDRRPQPAAPLFADQGGNDQRPPDQGRPEQGQDLPGHRPPRRRPDLAGQDRVRGSLLRFRAGLHGGVPSRERPAVRSGERRVHVRRSHQHRRRLQAEPRDRQPLIVLVRPATPARSSSRAFPCPALRQPETGAVVGMDEILRLCVPGHVGGEEGARCQHLQPLRPAQSRPARTRAEPTPGPRTLPARTCAGTARLRHDGGTERRRRRRPARPRTGPPRRCGGPRRRGSTQ